MNHSLVLDRATLGLRIRMTLYNIRAGIFSIKADRLGSPESNVVLDLDYAGYLKQIAEPDNSIHAIAYLFPTFTRLLFTDGAAQLDVSNLTLYRWLIEALIREILYGNSRGGSE